ncbi:hypothetical protein [Vulcanisaeta souniana]|nr:hypothetical protein [Vulcanisaeta souniana]
MWMEEPEARKGIERWLIIKKARLTNHYRRALRYEIEPGRGLVLLEPSIEELKSS